MFRNYLTSTLRRLARSRTYTAINVLGLAIGMACAILIYLYVDHRSGSGSLFDAGVGEYAA